MSATTQLMPGRSREGTPNRKRNTYRTRSYSSDVDETLFGSPSRFMAQKETLRINPDDVSWDPPWVTSPRKSGAPLLWTPYDGNDDTTKSKKAGTPRRPTTPRNKYRLKKQVPSYVDETLFGTRRNTRLSTTPWATDDGDKSVQPQATWSPPLDASGLDMSIESKKIDMKPDTEASDMRYTPVIKARSGSTINTPQSGSKVSRFRGYDEGNPPPKLDFCIENGANNGSTEDNPNAIIQRALKLAGVSTNSEKPRYRSNSLEGLSSRAITPGRYFWRRRPTSPSSTSSRPSTSLSGQLHIRSQSHPDTKVDDLFSATGTRVPLSARSASMQTEDSVPGLDLSKPPRLHGGARTPRSARSISSGQSSVMNRPSWRP